jgi:hypothetical protein
MTRGRIYARAATLKDVRSMSPAEASTARASSRAPGAARAGAADAWALRDGPQLDAAKYTTARRVFNSGMTARTRRRHGGQRQRT